MAKKGAPVSLTGGAGYSFEDEVAAWFLTHLLTGEILLEPLSGYSVAVDFQVRESGWLLDDLVITNIGREDQEHRCAVSVKRHSQVTSAGFPSDFVETIWEQWLGLDLESNTFRQDEDYLCLATGHLAESVKSEWDEISQQAAVTKPARLAKRLTSTVYSNSVQRALFASLRCPEALAQRASIEDVDILTARLLSRIRLLYFDFRSPTSRDRKMAIRLCHQALQDGSREEAIELWGKLVMIAAELRPRGGSIDLPSLLRRLSGFSFEAHPNYRQDWNRLEELSADAATEVRTQLGQGITVPRESLRAELLEQLQVSGHLVLLGESGSGKSALAKFISTDDYYQRTVWLTGEHLDATGHNSVKRSSGLDHNLTEILPSAGEARALLILDALERFSPHSLQNAVELIKVLEVGTSKSRWDVLMTVQPLRWETVQLQLRRYGLQLSQEWIRQIEPPEFYALKPVTRALPSLKRPMLEPGLSNLLRNLKILDWVASSVSSDPRTKVDWIGVSEIIDSIWAWWRGNDADRYSRESVLKKVGKEEAKSFSRVVVLDSLTIPEQAILSDLENLGLIRVQEGRVNFTHDLIGDWSRLQTLVAIPPQRRPVVLRERAENPRWHNAIRLCGLRSLERSSDSQPWFELIRQVDDGSALGQLAAALLLESVAFANNAYQLLERTWPYLSGEEAALLNKLLQRFRHSASFPDPRVAALTPDKELRIWLASSTRIPFWPYWAPMLRFLHAHAAEVKELALEPAAGLCHLWLSQMPAQTQQGDPFPWRREAAELALILARELHALQAEKTLLDGEGHELVYEAFLYAAVDLPEQVSTLALELAKRRPPAAEVQQRAEESVRHRAKSSQEYEGPVLDDEEFREIGVPPTRPSWLGDPREPWPSGPKERVDETFRKVCLEKGALLGLTRERPEIAKEIILALCIEAPQLEIYASDPIMGMRHGTAHTTDKAMFFSGPFLMFLNANPKKAIETIIELVDFATERWREWANAKDGIAADPETNEDQTVDIWINDNKRRLIGDSRVLGWYRERLVDAPYLVSALMALEKWLYDKVEAGEDVSDWVDLILNNSRSVAFIGVLVALGKKAPQLLTGCLEPILSVWQIYKWDELTRQYDSSGVAGITLMSWVEYGEEIFNLVRDWHAMSHRKLSFRDLVIAMWLGSSEIQSHFRALQPRWQALLEKGGDPKGSLAYLIERFNLDNYRLRRDDDGQHVADFEWPEPLSEESQTALTASSYSLNLMNFPFKCREVLENGVPLDPGEIENLWHTLEFFVNEFEDRGDSIEYLNNAVMGGIAVLMILHQDWLEAREEKEEWCAQQIDRILSSDHDRQAFDTPRDVSDTRWEGFLGEIAVHVLADAITEENIRILVAHSVLAYHYKTTELVCKAAFRLREDLETDFGRLLNLCRIWAGIRWSINWRNSRQVQYQETQLAEWYDSALHSFVDRTLQEAAIPLRQIANRSVNLTLDVSRAHQSATDEEAPTGDAGDPARSGSDDTIVSQSHLGLDWEIIQAAYAWLPPLAEATSEQERRSWIAVYDELLQFVLHNIRAAPRDQRGEVPGTPYQFEYWVFELIAGLLPQLKETDHPERFWQPILDLGASAHYWVDSFLSRWFMSGSKAAPEPSVFVHHWQAMVAYALDSPLWRDDTSTPSRYRLTNLYIKLMGLGLGGSIFDDERYAGVIGHLFPLYEKWATEWLEYSRVATAFARFLTKPACRDMMLPGLTWLAHAIPQIPERGWERDRLSDALLSLLDTCWKEHLFELETMDEVKEAFLDLLNVLVAQGHPGALTLQDVILDGS